MADTFPELIHLERCDGETVWIEGHPDSDEAEAAVYIRAGAQGNTVRLLSEVAALTAERDRLLEETSNAGERVAQLGAELSAARDAEVRARAGRRASFEEAQRYRAERDDALAVTGAGQQACPECGGSGNERGHTVHPPICRECDGAGLFSRREPPVPAELMEAPHA